MIRATILHQRVEVARKVTKAMPGAMSKCDQLIDGDVNRGVSFPDEDRSVSNRGQIGPTSDHSCSRLLREIHLT